MTIANCVNSLGLVLDIIGAFLLWNPACPRTFPAGTRSHHYGNEGRGRSGESRTI